MVVTETVFHILNAENLARLAEKVETVNRRLERNDFADRFTFVATENELVESSTEGVFLPQSFSVIFNRPSVEVDGWRFVGSVNAEGEGVLVNLIPGENTDGLERVTETRCDHCNQNRARKASYIIRNTETGEFKVVGSTCIELFFGIEVKGLWLLGDFTLEEIAAINEDRGPAREAMIFSVGHILRLALAVTDMGKNFISRGRARDFGGAASADSVLAVLFPNNKERPWAAEMSQVAATVSDEVVAAVIASADTLRDGDYADNMRVVLGNETVSFKGLGTLVSLVSVWARNETKKAESAGYVAGFLGAAKDKLTGIEATVTFLREIEGDYGITTLIGFRTADGHSVKWFASNPPPGLEIGTQVVITRATVKGTENYQGTDNTLITRAKLEVAS